MENLVNYQQNLELFDVLMCNEYDTDWEEIVPEELIEFEFEKFLETGHLIELPF